MLLCGSKPADTRLAMDPIGFGAVAGNGVEEFLVGSAGTAPGTLLCIEPIILCS